MSVKSYTPALKAECSAVIVSAFSSDPVLRTIAPTSRYSRIFTPVCGCFLWSYHSSYGMVDVVEGSDGSCNAAALWEPGQMSLRGLLSTLASLPFMLWVMGPRKFSLMLRLLGGFEAILKAMDTHKASKDVQDKQV